MDTDPTKHERPVGPSPASGTDAPAWDAATIARFERLRSGSATPDAGAPDEADPLAACLAAVGSPSCPLEAIERERPLADAPAREELRRHMRDDSRKLLDSIALLVIGVLLASIGAIFRERAGVLLAMGGILGGLVLLRAAVNSFRRRLINRLCESGRAGDALARLERLNMHEAVVVAAAHIALAVGGGFVIADRWTAGREGSAIAFGLILGLPFLGRTIATVRSAILLVRRRGPILRSAR